VKFILIPMLLTCMLPLMFGSPRNRPEWEARFSTDEACRDYLFRLRWPKGFSCPRCAYSRAWPLRRAWYECASCRCQTSVTAGTIFQDTHKPLTLWFHALWWAAGRKAAFSAVALQSTLGLTNYQTAWTWLQKLRRIMIAPGLEWLAGSVDLDVVTVKLSGSASAGRRRKAPLIALAVRRRRQHAGETRLQRIADSSEENLLRFARDHIEPGTVVFTRDSPAYAGLGPAGYVHKVVRLKPPLTTTPRIRCVRTCLRRWLESLKRRGAALDNFDYCLDEFTFRLNHRDVRSQGELFQRLVQRALTVKPATYESMVRAARNPQTRTVAAAVAWGAL
jgi:hypothetical protein